MNTLRSLWAGVEFSPRALQRLHGWLTITWLIIIPIALITGWIYSIVFISAISIYANVAGHFSGWQAARTEVKQDETSD